MNDTPIHLKRIDGSLKNKTPIIKVPAAPIPVHTAYAVPIDIPLRESHSKMPLIVIDKTEITGPNTLYDGIADSFNPSGHPISKSPAAIK